MSITINTQTQLNAELSTSTILGDLTINDSGQLLANQITQLEWPALTTVTGTLRLTLEQLRSLDDAFPNLANVGSIIIRLNLLLESISVTAFPKVTQALIEISNNPELINVSGFQSVTLVRQLSIFGNPLLSNLSGFCGLSVSQGSITISNNPSLTNLDPFCSLISVPDLSPDTAILIADNILLNRFCGLAPIASNTIDSQWSVSGNLTNPTRAQIAALDACVPEWVEPLPANLIRYICGSTGTDSPTDTGIPDVLYAKTLDYKDVIVVEGCITTTTRTWTAEGFCGSDITFVQTIIDERTCPLTIVCPEDYTVTCADSNLCPSTTGSPSVQGALPDAYEVTYLDFVFKRDLKTCKPLIIKRRWAVTSDCPKENSVVYCVQTICVPRGWPHFTTCGFTPGQFCGLG